MGYIIFFIACAFIGTAIGENKGRGGTGFILGLLLGPLGCIIVLAISGDRVNCPFCQSRISPNATSCPKCTKDLSELEGEIAKGDEKNKILRKDHFMEFKEWKVAFIERDPKNIHFTLHETKNVYLKEKKLYEEEINNQYSKVDSSYLEELDNKLVDKKISLVTHGLLKRKFLSEQKTEHGSGKKLNEIRSINLEDEKYLDQNVEKRLQILNNIKEKGLITDIEYNKKKEEILKSL